MDFFLSFNTECEEKILIEQEAHAKIRKVILAIFSLSLLFVGVGQTAVSTLGIPYIDDNVASRESPIYIGEKLLQCTIRRTAQKIKKTVAGKRIFEPANEQRTTNHIKFNINFFLSASFQLSPLAYVFWDRPLVLYSAHFARGSMWTCRIPVLDHPIQNGLAHGIWVRKMASLKF